MRLFFVLFLAVVCGFVVGALVASSYLTVVFGQSLLDADPLLYVKSLQDNFSTEPPYRTAHIITGASVAIFIVLGVVTVLFERLVRYGERHFQSLSELRRNRMLGPLGSGFLLGQQVAAPRIRPDRPVRITKTSALTKKLTRSRFVSGAFDKIMNILLVAPTRSGKGVGFVIPNALTFPGSMVVLDVKGELWDETSRARSKMGDKVYRFAPLDYKNPSHQYNPLTRLLHIDDMEELWTGLERIAGLLLQSEKNADWLEGGKKVFVAAGVLAIQRENPTLGEIYRILFGTGEGRDIGRSGSDLLLAAAKEVQYAPAARELSKLAGLDPKIQQSYLSVLSSAGLNQWSNPKIERVTRKSDFDFRQMRREASSVYLVVPSDDLKDLKSLIRLFFADLISFLRSSKPEGDEPWPIFILLDEFDQLGHMPLVVEAMKQTAGHGGRFGIVTQSIPGLLSIPYTPEEVKAIESACQVKLYIAANEDQTAGELENALGTRTGSTISRTRSAHDIGFGGGSVTQSTEDRPLLSKQEIRGMDEDKMIVVPERQNPILVERIKYYETPEVLALYNAQKGTDYPFPDAGANPRTVEKMSDLRRAAQQAAQETEQKDEAVKAKIHGSKPKIRDQRKERSKPKSKGERPLSPGAAAALMSLQGPVSINGSKASPASQASSDKTELQGRQEALLKAQQERGVPLVQRREDGVYVARSADGTEVERPYQDAADGAPFEA